MSTHGDEHEPTDRLDDEALGSALGEALGADADDIILPPPVSSIAERAAAKARARNARRAVGSVAASVALIAGGVVGWQALSDDGADGEEDLAAAVSPDDAEIESAPASDDVGATQQFADVEPEDYTTGPVLEWSEIDGPGPNSGGLMALADGRVVARLWDGEQDRILVSADGVSWEPLATPPGMMPGIIELSDDLWVVTGFTHDDVEFRDQVFVSDDEGATWSQIVIGDSGVQEDGYLRTQTFVNGAVPLGDQVVVVTSSYTDLDMGRIIVDLGLAETPDQLRGWGYEGGGGLTVDVGPPIGPDGEVDDGGDPFASETFELIPEDLGLPADFDDRIGGDGSERFRIHIGDADGVELIEERTGSASRLMTVGETLAMTVWGETGTTILTSTDGRSWTETSAPDGFEIAGGLDGAIWGIGWSEPFTALRLDGGVLTEVASFPGLVSSAVPSANASGIVATVDVDRPFPDGESFPTEPDESVPPELLQTGVIAARDGIELRVEEDGSGVLVDVETEEILRSFSRSEMEGEEPPPGVVESSDVGDYTVRIEDVETGEELVTFRLEDYAIDTFVGDDEASISVEAGSEPLPESGDWFEYAEGTELAEGGYLPPETWIGWSANGTDWGFERIADAFGLGDGEEAWAQVAIGDGFVVALVETWPTTGVPEESEEPLAARWFIARVDPLG